MIDKKDIKQNRFMKAFKGLMIFGTVFTLVSLVFLGYVIITKATTGIYPPWLYSKTVQNILQISEAQANEPLPEPLMPTIVYKNPYEHTDDMRILSLYIRGRVKNTPIELADRIAYEVCKQSREKGIPYEVTVGIVEVESMWNPRAKSKKNARGLMQALIEDGIEIDKEKLYGIEYNIDIGLQILISKIKKSKGSLNKALLFYVGGDPTYKDAVYAAMGKYLLFKITHVEES